MLAILGWVGCTDGSWVVGWALHSGEGAEGVLAELGFGDGVAVFAQRWSAGLVLFGALVLLNALLFSLSFSSLSLAFLSFFPFPRISSPCTPLLPAAAEKLT